MTRLKLSIEGMHCGACIRRVSAALGALPGVTVDAVEVGTAKLEFDSALSSLPQIRAAVERIGFTVPAGIDVRE